MRQWIMTLFFAMLLHPAFAATPLPPDQAFSVSVTTSSSNVVMVDWKIAPDYYLYADKLHFAFIPDTPFTMDLPKTVIKDDAIRGQTPIYTTNARILLQLQNPASTVQLKVQYQGCSKEGFCYPPTEKTFSLILTPAALFTASARSLLTDQNSVQSAIAQQPIGMMLLIFAGLGILLAFTPCVLPMLPILTGIIVGQKQNNGARKAFFLSLAYVIGMSIAYAFAGMIAAMLGGSLQVWLQQPLFIGISSALFVLLALSMFEFYELPLSRRWQHSVLAWSGRHEGGTYVGVFFMGMLSTLIVSPCVTAPLVGVLMYIGQSGDIFFGASALFIMGLGMGIPLLLIGISAGKWLPKTGPWMVVITKVFGILMLGIAIWLLSRIVSSSVTTTLTLLYLIGIVSFFFFYLPRVIGQHHINRGLGLAAAVIGGMMIFSMQGMHSIIEKWTGMPVLVQSVRDSMFIVVKNMSQLDAQMKAAEAAKRPVMLDFYASWCDSCVDMDKNVFDKVSVRDALKEFVLIRADISENTEESQEMMKHFSVLAPPTVLFFNIVGQEINSRRIVGEIDEKDFLNRLNLFMAGSCDKKAQC